MDIPRLKKQLNLRSISWRDCAMVAIGALAVLAGVLTTNYIHNRQVPIPLTLSTQSKNSIKELKNILGGRIGYTGMLISG